jgi:hypothetical protein
MKNFFSRTSRLVSYFIFSVLSLMVASASAADSNGSGTYAGQAFGKPVTIAFKDVYAFRGASRSDGEQVTVLILSETPLDKKAMTAALKKSRDRTAIDKYLEKAFIRLKVEADGKMTDYYLYVPPGSNINVSSSKTKSDVKVNTPKRVEGRFSHDDTDSRGESRKIELRFATDLADIGPPIKM